MATVHLSPIGNGFQFLGRGGQPLINGTLYTYQTGSSTPAATYTTLAGNVQNSNPINLLADGRLANEVWLIEGVSYRFQLYDQVGVLIQTLDNIYGINDLSVNSGVLPGTSVSFLQFGTGALTRQNQDKLREFPVSVIDYGATGDGTTDDTAAIQAAITAVAPKGGAVYFPSQKAGSNMVYKVTSQIAVQSKYPVDLISDMTGFGQLTPFGSYILIGANITGSVFKYSTPTANRGDAGGGVIRGLAFRDNTGGSSLPGTFTLTACLELTDFNVGKVEDCYFHFINGSAIKTVFCVMTDIVGCVIRYCGAALKPALYILPTDATYTTQSVNVVNLRSEVNSGAPYISINQYAEQVKFIGCGFEADTAIAGSNQNFIYLNTKRIAFVACHFNRNTAVQVNVDTGGQLSQFSSCIFYSTANAVASVTLGGVEVCMTGCTFASGKTGDEITVSGQRCTITGCTFDVTGGINVTGEGNTITGCTFTNLTTTNAYWILGVAANVVITGNILDGDVTGVAGGIKLTGTTPTVMGNVIKDLVGIGIRIETSNGCIQGNSIYQTTAAALSVNGVNAERVMNNWVDDATNYLQGSKVFDPPNLAALATTQTTVTVTGAVAGDFCIASFDTYATTLVVLMSAVTGADTVTVTFWNTDAGSAHDLASGTLRAKVWKV